MQFVFREEFRKFKAALSKFISLIHAMSLNSSSDALFLLSKLCNGANGKVSKVYHKCVSLVDRIVAARLKTGFGQQRI